MLELSDRIEAVLQMKLDIDEQIDALYDQKRAQGKKLKELQAQVELICQGCGHTTILADSELVLEIYYEHYCKIDEETYSSKRLLWVCPSCAYLSNIRDDDDPKWGNPKNLAKKVHTWHSDPGSRRVGEEKAVLIMAPALEKLRKERVKREKEQKLANARAILRENGEL